MNIDFKKLKAVAIDLDGVVYCGNKIVPGAIAAIESFRRSGLKVFFVTNNSGKKRAEIAAKLNSLGVLCAIDEVITSGYAAALFVKKLRSRRPVLVIGSDSLREEFKKAGITLTKTAKSGVLVVGLDRNYTYDKIAVGAEAISQGAVFVASNIDACFPVEGGKYLPGCGAMVAAIEAAAGKKADHIIGKPNTFMLKMITKAHSLRPAEVLVIGDSLQSDIGMATKFGSPAVLISKRKTSRILTVPSLLQARKRMEGAQKIGS
jgi:HAD superfamily hydrolase (TIGR01450 family)